MTRWLERLRRQHGRLVPLPFRHGFETGDVLAEAMLRVLKAEPRRFGSERELLGWCRKVFRYQLLDLMRGMHRQKRAVQREQRLETGQGAADQAASGPGPRTEASRAEMVANFEAAVATLADAGDRALLRAWVLQERSRDEIARDLGISVAAVGDRLRRLLIDLAPLFKSRMRLSTEDL